MEYSNEELKIAAIKKFNMLQENPGDTVISGMKPMNRRNTFPKRVEF